MRLFWPEATTILFTGAAGSPYLGGPFRGVLHTTEIKSYTPSATDYYGHTNAPHFTLATIAGETRMFQHYPIDIASRALRNPPGGVETNRRSAIQIEIAWTADDIQNLPDPMVQLLKRWMRWVEVQAHVERVSPPFLGSEAHGAESPSRMSPDTWNNFNGWCGHQHVPENTHWDPGKIGIATLFDIGPTA